MSRTWVIADPHFGHQNILNFKRNDGTPLRPGFKDADHMDSVIVNNWNELVDPKDRVYVLGDLALNRKSIEVIGRCNGRKVLVKGNHDIYKIEYYLPYFDDIRACVTSPHQYILSHIPLHSNSMGRWKVNIHGHLHSNRVLDDKGKIDKRYYCVSVEQIGMKPKLLDDILKELEIR